jgi:hypothetical protein
MHDLSLHVLDLIENSLRAKATIVAIRVDIDEAADLLQVCVEDNGEGIRVPSEEVLNPFYTTNRMKKVGLGLSFFKAAAEMAGGKLTLARSAELGGVAVTVRMELTHVNRPTLGDLATTVSTMIFLNPEIDFRLIVRSGARIRRFGLAEFMKSRGLSGSANVQLASAVHEALRVELEPWSRCELISWMARWSAGSEMWMCAKQGKANWSKERMHD